MAYDQSCWDLAKAFLEDGPRCLPPDIDALAQAIQDVCQDHCQAIEEQERGSQAVAGERVIYRQPEGEVITVRSGESFSIPIPNK